MKERGNQLYKQRNFDEAISLYKLAWDTYKDPTYLNNRLAAEIEKGDLQAALYSSYQAVEKGRELNADAKILAKSYNRLATIHSKLDAPGMTARFYCESLKVEYNPDIVTKLQATQKELKKLETKEFAAEKAKTGTPKVYEPYTQEESEYDSSRIIHKLQWNFRTKYRVKPNGDKEPYYKVFSSTSTPVPKSRLYRPSQQLLRMVLSHAIGNKYSIQQYDINLSDIHIELPEDEQVYVRYTVGLLAKTPDHDGLVVRPYPYVVVGAKHSEKLFYEHFDSFLTELGFKLFKSDKGIWVLASEGRMKVIVMIADDDILLCGRTDADVKWIASKFEEKHKNNVHNLGTPLSMMGNEINYDAKLGKVTQTRVAFTERLVQKYRRRPNKTSKGPIDPLFELEWYTVQSKNVVTGPALATKKKYYSRLIADMMALLKSVRCDLGAVVAILAHLTPHVNDWLIRRAEQLLDYFIETKNEGMEIRVGFHPTENFEAELLVNRNDFKPFQVLVSPSVYSKYGLMDYNFYMFVCPEKVLEGDIKYTLEQEAPTATIDDLSPAEVTQAAAYKRGNDEMEAMIDRLDELNYFLLYGEEIPKK